MELRCFIAITLPDPLKESMKKVIDGLMTSGADVRWVPAGNIHLTLKFLGSTNDTIIPEITERLSKKLSHFKPFYIKIGGIGCFPSDKRPRVIWIGAQDTGQMQDMQKGIDSELVSFGFAREERSFSPHLTIGRVRSPNKIPELMRRFAEFRDADFGSVEVTQIHIMKSELTAGGAEYSVLAGIPLRNREE